jgi:hypothetical protein
MAKQEMELKEHWTKNYMAYLINICGIMQVLRLLQQCGSGVYSSMV